MALKRASPPYLFLFPFFVLFVMFVLLPIAYDAYLSLYRNTLFGRNFVGLQNFRDAVSDPVFWSSLLQVAKFGIIQVPLMLVLATLFAVLIDLAYVPFGKLLRLLLFLPYTIPIVLVTLVWSFLYQPSFGALTQTLNNFGIHDVNFLGSGLVLGSIVNVDTWALTGFNMLIIFTALQAVPQETVESAVVDGASVWRIAVQIKLPQVRSVIIGLGLFGLLFALQLFSEPYLMSSLTSAISSHYTPGMLIYNVATGQDNNGYAAAVAFLLTVLSLVFAAVLAFSVFAREGHRAHSD